MNILTTTELEEILSEEIFGHPNSYATINKGVIKIHFPGLTVTFNGKNKQEALMEAICYLHDKLSDRNAIAPTTGCGGGGCHGTCKGC